MINFLTDVEIIILSTILPLIFIILFGIVIFSLTKNKKKHVQDKVVEKRSNEEFVNLLGGKDNIISFELKGNSRLALELKDYKLIKRDELKKFYISRTLEMSNKIILVGENLKPLEEILKSI